MKGDTNKPGGIFCRWIEWFWDGNFRTTSKGKRKVPSSWPDKKYERRWRRRRERKNLSRRERDE